MKPEIILGLVTLLSALLTFFLAFNVGTMRRKYKVGALETTKEKQVLIAIRTHMNQVENMAVYLPVLWVAGIFGPIKIVSLVGVVWLISRVVYSYMYLKNPAKRELPFIVGVVCIVVTSLLALVGMFL